MSIESLESRRLLSVNGGTQRLFAVPQDNSADLVELDPNSGVEIHRYAAPVTPTHGPDGLAFDGTNLYFLANQTLWKLNPDTGAVIDSHAITGGSGSYDGLGAVGGKLYISDYSRSDILVYNPATNLVTGTLDINGLNPGVSIIGGVSGITGPNALIASTASSMVVEIDPATGLVTHSFFAPNSGIYGVSVVNGQIYLGRNAGLTIDVVDRSGVFVRSIATQYGVSALGGDDGGGSALSGEIHGAKWNDLNANGVWDQGEPGLPGWIIYLDANNNGILDGELATTTDANGNYSFSGLPAGTYTVAEFMQPGWVQTYPGTGPQMVAIANGGFETGNMTGWTVELSGSASFVINNGAFDPPGPDGPLAPYAGAYSALFQQSGPGTSAIYQDIYIPTGNYPTLHWRDQIHNHATTFQDPNQEYRVEIRNLSNQTLATVFSTNPGDPLATDWTDRSVDLSAYAGQTIRIAFVVESDINYFNVQIDDVRVGASNGAYVVTLSNGQGATGLNFGNVVAAPPMVGISPETVVHGEGDGGLTPYVFTVALSGPSVATVSVAYATADGTATAGSDYQPTGGILTFFPGQTTRQITVLVNGDTTFEEDEYFTVTLSNPVNATLGVAGATGLIFNDDQPQLVSVNPTFPTQIEGNVGVTPYEFTVSLSAPVDQSVTVEYSSVNGSATAGSDYQAATGTLTFAPGETTRQVTVWIYGDTTFEMDETFAVVLDHPTNAVLGLSQAIAAIINDDAPPSTVVGRYLFYNQSGTSTRYDHNDAAINSFDDAAIATDKTAYLWEDAGAATFANVSSYTKGINGVMVDISGSHPNISADDFIFRVGNNNSPGLWGTANAPASVSVRAGAGVGGSDRVEIIWNNGAAPIRQWLEVIVLANADTGLQQKAGYPAGQGDAFFFGSAVGDSGSGDTVTFALVNVIDESGARLNPALAAANIPVTNIYDFDRSALVNVIDQSVARLNATNPVTALKYLNLTSAPAAPELDAAESDVPTGDAGVVSALAAGATTSDVPSVLQKISSRIDGTELRSAATAQSFEYGHDQNRPRFHAALGKLDAAAHSLALDDELLDSLLVALGLE